jgi:two-component system, OmpR family, KDP operon response regulator KdpE
VATGDRSGARVLVVDDDPQILRALRTNLAARGYQVQTAPDGEGALDAFARQRPDLIVLDLGLPGMDGLEVIRRVREQTQTPIVVLSAREAEPDKVRALDLGADDYLTKPFGVQELLARVRVALRHASHSAASAGPLFETGELRVDLERRLVFRLSDEVHLTPTEYKLLVTLVRNAGKVLTHRHLLHEVWGANYEGQTHYLRVYMAQLRQKLERDSARPRLLLTEPGVGYRLMTRA